MERLYIAVIAILIMLIIYSTCVGSVDSYTGKRPDKNIPLAYGGVLLDVNNGPTNILASRQSGAIPLDNSMTAARAMQDETSGCNFGNENFTTEVYSDLHIQKKRINNAGKPPSDYISGAQAIRKNAVLTLEGNKQVI